MNVRARFTLLFSLAAVQLPAQTVSPRHQEGRLRGFVVVRTLAGRQIGYGDIDQTVEGDRVTYRATYRFRDGSLDEETTVFSQQKAFSLISDRHIQRGPLFPHPLDLTTDASGDSTNRSVGSGGKTSLETSHLDLPAGTVANGMMGTVMANLDPSTQSLKLAALTPTPKPRLMHLAIAREGRGTFRVAGAPQPATIFRVKLELGGIAGVIAPIIGKQPDDVIVWVLEGDAPTLVRAIAQLSDGGPLLDIQFAGATFPRAPAK